MRVLAIPYHHTATGLRLLCTGLMIASAVLFREVQPWYAGALMMVAGFLVMGLSLRLKARPLTQPALLPSDVSPLKIHLSLLVPGVAALLLVAEWSGGLTGKHQISNHMQFIVLLLGMLLVALAVQGGALRLTWPRLRIGPPAVALLLITLLALGLRLWQLETAVHYFIDEINFGRVARYIVQGNNVPMVAPFSDVAAFPWIYPYWQAHGIWALEQNLSALRIVSVIIGTLSIPAFYLLIRTLFADARMGLLAALLLATFPPHVHFSRVGINNIADVLVGVLLLAFLARGLQTRRQVDFALAGVALGLTQYFYEGGRVIYPLLALLWLLLLLVVRRLRLDRALLQRLVLTALTGALIAMPVYYALAARDLPLFARYQTTGLGGSYHRILQEFDAQQTLEQHLTWPFLIYVQMAERSQFYGGETPLLLVFVAPFVLLGLAYSLWHLRHPALMLAVLWVLLVSAGSAALANSAYAARYVVVLPALMLLAVAGIVYISGTWGWLALMIAAALAVGSVGYYFGPHLTDFNRQLRPYPDIQDALFRAAQMPTGGQVCLITERVPDPQFVRDIADYVAPHIEHCIIPPEHLSPEILDSLIARRPFVVLFVEPDDLVNINLLKATGMEGPFYSPYDSVPAGKQFARYNTPLP